MTPTTNSSDLLAEYGRSRSAAAFEQIVAQYVNLVHAAAVRQVRDRHLAEDVTQAVFLILAQRAASIHPDASVTGWFLLTTRNVARNAIKRERRLKLRERKAAQMLPTQQDAPALPAEAVAIAPLLDDALARLNASDRDAILQRFFQSRSHRDIGTAMGLSEEAASKRVSRALGKLRRILEGLGVNASEAVLSSILPLLATHPPAPAALVSLIHASASTTAAASSGATALARTSAGAASGNYAGWMIAATVAILLGVGGIIATARLGKSPNSPQNVPAAAPAAGGVAVSPPPAPAGTRTVTIIAIDAKTKQPIPDASVESRLTRNYAPVGKTGADGRLTFSIPDDFQIMSVRIIVAGRVPMMMQWSNSTFRGGVPPVYTVPLEEGVTVGGFVRDAAGNPVVGARVDVSIAMPDSLEEPFATSTAGRALITDAQGHWQYKNAPTGLQSIYASASHPSFPASLNNISANLSVNDLRAGTAVVVLKSEGRGISGVVTDAATNKPVPGATLTAGEDYFLTNRPTATSDEQGRFELKNLDQYTHTVTIIANGYAPELVKLTEAEKIEPLQVRLGKPNTVEAFIVNADGSPVTGAEVSLEQWRGRRAMKFTARTDAQGHFIWTQAPADAMLFDIVFKDTTVARYVPIKANAPAVKIPIYPALKISGRVLDAETQEPIDKFTMTSGFKWNLTDQDVTWQPGTTRSLTDGQYEATITDFYNGGRIRVEADGYLTSSSRLIMASEGPNITINFLMAKGIGPAGTVVDSSGKPLSDITVYCSSQAHTLYVADDQSTNLLRNSAIGKTQTDATGRFELKPQLDQDYILLAMSDSGGIAVASAKDLAKSPQMKLRPWGRIEGTLRLGTKPAAGQGIGAEIELSGKDVAPQGVRAQVEVMRTATTDADGHFAIEHVPAGQVRLIRLVPVGNNGTRYVDLQQVEIAEGKMATVSVGGGGRPVIGKVIRPAGIPGSPSPLGQDINLSASPSDMSMFSIPYPDNFPDMTGEQRQAWYEKFLASPEGIALQKKIAQMPSVVDFVLQPDGSLRADDVRPGTYTLRAQIIHMDRVGHQYVSRTMAKAVRQFTVPEKPIPSDDPLDLGSMEMTIVTPAVIGQPLPPVSLLDLDGKPIMLDQMHGNVVLVHLWGTNQTALFEAVKKLGARYKDEPRLVIVNVGSGQVPSAWAKRIGAREQLPGLQAVDPSTVAGHSESQESIFDALSPKSLPAACLLGADGTLIATDLTADTIEPAVEKALSR